MSETDNRLRPRGTSNDCGLTSVTATCSATLCHRPPQQKERQSLDATDSQSAVGSVNASETQSLGIHNLGCNKFIYPTLKLRFGLSQSDAWEEAVAQKRQAAGRSRTPIVQKPLKAITLPRRIPTSTKALSIESANSLSPRHSNSSSSTSKWLRPPPACLPSVGCKEQLLQRQRLEKLSNRLTFEQWLVVKRKQEDQVRRQLQLEHNLLMEKQFLRRQMADKSFDDWLKAKQQCCRTDRMQQAKKRQLAEQNIDSARREETQRCLEQWEKRKLLELQRRRELRMFEEENAKTRDQLRKYLAQLAWQRWLTQAEARELSRKAIPTPAPVSTPVSDTTTCPMPPYLLANEQNTAMTKQQRKLQDQLHNLYLHVPLSAAQRSLQQRLCSGNNNCLQRRKKSAVI